MSDNVDDVLLRSLDQFMGAVYWSDEPITLEEALTEAIGDWVAMASAEHNNSQPFANPSASDDLGSNLVEMAAAVSHLESAGAAGISVPRVLSVALGEWLDAQA